MKKKILITLLAASVLGVGTVFAEELAINGLTLDDGKVTVTGTADSARLAIKVIPSDDISETDIANVIEMNEIVPAGGSFVYEFKMPDIWGEEKSDGAYTVYVTGGEKVSKEFMYISSATRQGLLDFLNTADDIGAVFSNEEYKYAFSNLGADVDFYNNLDSSDKKKFVEIFENVAGENEISGENLSAIYNTAVIIQKVNNNDTADDVLISFGFVFEETEYKGIEDEELKAWIKKILGNNKPYVTKGEIEAVYEEANVLYILNTAKYTKYDELIDKYDDVLDIKSGNTYEDYTDLSDSKQSTVRSELKNMLAKNPAESYDDFGDAFDDAYDKATETKKGGGGGGGSASSGGTKVSGTGGGLSISGVEDYPAAEKAPEFSDMSTAEWAREAVEALAKRGIISGYGDGTFKPDKEVTREEFVKMIILAMDINTDKPACSFADVDAGAWYAPYVNAAVSEGLITGRSETEFGIGDGIIRQDMAVIVKRGIGELPVIKSYTSFSDESNISDYAKSAVQALYRAGKISGMSADTFAPKGAVTRAQAAKILYDTFTGGAR